MNDCMCCGRCCTVGPCTYGRYDYNNKGCTYLLGPNELGQRLCSIWDDIEKKEKGAQFSMVGCGCSSTLFNDDREAVIKQLQKQKKPKPSRSEDDLDDMDF